MEIEAAGELGHEIQAVHSQQPFDPEGPQRYIRASMEEASTIEPDTDDELRTSVLPSG